MDAALKSAVEGLYRTFGRYRFDPTMGFCDHCHTAEDVRRLGAPLRELTAGDLADYVFSATLTWGGPEDWKHFLPRVAELVAGSEDLDGWVGVEIAFRRFSDAGWTGWPEAERGAVATYLSALWEASLRDFDEPGSTGDFLCCFGQVIEAWAPWVDRWRRLPGDAPGLHLASFLVDELQGWRLKRRLANAYWRSREASAASLMAALEGSATAETLREAARRHGAGPHAELIADALRIL